MPDIPSDITAKAAVIQDALNAEVTTLRSNGDLTPDGRMRLLAVAYTQARQQMDALQETWQGTSVTQAATIDKDVFGAPSVAGADAISMRDAADRASRLESGTDGMRLLEQAERTGDEVLAQAVAQYAFDQRGPFAHGWADVVDAYAYRRPEIAQRLEELAAAQRADIGSSLAAGFVFSLAKPSELDRYSDHRISILAESMPPARRQPTQAERNRSMSVPTPGSGYDWIGRHQGLS